jgi:hypothetical protein
MRWLFLFMLVAFLFNGFDAGKHVFGATIEKHETKITGMDCCPDSKKETKSAATACHYCCSGLLALTKFQVVMAAFLPEGHTLPMSNGLISEPRDMPFRPPRLS